VTEFSRRGVLKALAAGVVGAGGGLAMHGYLWERHALTMVAAELPMSGLPHALDGLRIGVITDLHLSTTVPEEDVVRAIDRVQAERPDLLVLGGDYVSYADRRYMTPVAALLARASAPHGVFAILGNHDDTRDMPAALARHGIEVLRDARTAVAIRGETLHLAGIDFWTRKAGEIADVLRGAGSPVLLLAHDPRRIVEAAALDVGAVISGHTHGGQIVLPGVGALAARKFPTPGGLLDRDGTTLFVSRGVGTVVVPIRVNCPPEVAVLTLRRRAGF
jgi:predicted MPP superfamily phosphohydrolase